jgi:hypothetical protein
MLIIEILTAVIAVLSLVLTIVWHHKYDVKLHKLDIKEKEQHQQELLQATFNCYPLPREEKKLPQFRIENTGKHPAHDVSLELPQDFSVRVTDLFPYEKIAPGQWVDVIYISHHHGHDAVPVKLTFTDGLSRRDETCFVQL